MNKIILNPKQVQKLLDWIDIIPSNHYLCIGEDDNKNLYVSDYGKDGLDSGEKLEIYEEI